MKQTSQARRTEIVKRLFPEGIDETKIWNGFVVIIGRKGHERLNEHLSVERLRSVADRKLKLERRIKKHFPTAEDQLYVISQGDTRLLHKITQTTWIFSQSHKIHSQDAIVLRGRTPKEILLSWAALAVISMLLRHIEARL